MSTALAQLSKRLDVSEGELHSIVLNTVMPNGGRGVSNDQFVTFIAVANEYGLNPMVKEIYAFPAKGGGIQPIVSIDGWLKIINNHKDFNGMVFEDVREDGKLAAIKCKIYKKGIEHPVEVVEYMDECKKPNSEPWSKWPSRMLRHKAAIQCGRYAFGLSGIIDPDEAERYKDVGVIEKEDTAALAERKIEIMNCESLDDLVELWKKTNDEYKGKPELSVLNELKNQKKDELMNVGEDTND